MATYVATFADDTVGAMPSGWSARWDGVEFVIVADATATGGKVLRCPSVPGRNFLAWTDVPTVADFEILARVRIGSSNTGRFWLAGRGNASINSVHAGVYTGTTVTAARFVNGGGGLLSGASSLGKALPVGIWFRQRLRVTGNRVWYRTWPETAAEPATWDFNGLTDNYMPQIAGWVGVMIDGGSPTARDVDWFSVGTAGDAAIDPADIEEPPVEPEPTTVRNVHSGGASLDRIYVGGTEIDKVYVGTILLWGATQGSEGADTFASTFGSTF